MLGILEDPTVKETLKILLSGIVGIGLGFLSAYRLEWIKLSAQRNFKKKEERENRAKKSKNVRVETRTKQTRIGRFSTDWISICPYWLKEVEGQWTSPGGETHPLVWDTLTRGEDGTTQDRQEPIPASLVETAKKELKWMVFTYNIGSEYRFHGLERCTPEDEYLWEAR